MFSWVIVTDFGDSAGMVPAAVLLAIWLVASRAWRHAALWCLGFGLLAALVAASKIAFLGWGIGVQALDFTGISGHTALAVSVLSVGALVSLNDRPRAVRMVGATLGALAGAAIGLSRLALNLHSASEVAAGCVVGGGLALALIASGRYASIAYLRPGFCGAALLACLALSHGQRAPSQEFLTRVALSLSGRQEPYSRNDWLTAARATAQKPVQAVPPAATF